MTNVESAANTSRPAPAFHSDDLEPLAGYRTLSTLAIVSLLFGLAAPLCFVMPLLMAIPLFGAAISTVALRRIAESEGALAGRWAAVAGLVLCVASATAAVAHSQTTRYLRTGQAESIARDWLGLLLAGQTDQAFQLTSTGSRPPAPPGPGEPAPIETPLEHFSHQPLVAALAAAGPNSEIQLNGTETYEAQRSGQIFVGQRFAITPPPSATTDGAAPPEPIVAVLTLELTKRSGDRPARWLVYAHQAPGLSAPEGDGLIH